MTNSLSITGQVYVLETEVNLFFCDNKMSNCPLSFVDTTNVSVRLLTIKINKRARMSAVIVKIRTYVGTTNKAGQEMGHVGSCYLLCFFEQVLTLLYPERYFQTWDLR